MTLGIPFAPKCDLCEKHAAIALDDGTRVCGDCQRMGEDLLKHYPELNEGEPCIGCGAPVCEDALCKQDVADRMEERLYDEADEELDSAYGADLDYSDDAYALASAGWGTSEDYGCYGSDDDF